MTHTIAQEPETDLLSAVCPVPITDYSEVTLAHGSGGKLTHALIQKMMQAQFNNEYLEPLHDGAILTHKGVRFAFSTDSYVVSPIFFPGGDIGELAVNGTVNDLAMCGARPMYLSAGFIIEEGFVMEKLWQVVQSMQNAARRAGVLLVTGDTKVVNRGKGDQIYINTSGIGMVPDGVNINPANVKSGDKIILNGTIADHGMAIISVREGLEFETEIKSDTAALNGLVEAMLEAYPGIHMLRDATRGGIASVMCEIAESSGKGVRLYENKIPVKEEVKSACEMLGFDPLFVANEGKMIAVVPPEACDKVLQAMQAHPLGKDAVVIGEIVSAHAGSVMLQTLIGGQRLVDMFSGEQLPRIC